MGIAVDDDKNRFEASDFVTYMLVRDIVLKRQNTDTAIPNSAAFLKKFEKKLSKNGLEIGFDGKLHGVEASKNKPLLTKKELFNQYLQNRRTEINNLRR